MADEEKFGAMLDALPPEMRPVCRYLEHRLSLVEARYNSVVFILEIFRWLVPIVMTALTAIVLKGHI